ncbi:uncharacterized protein [Palaemon carinicauda]|uniref:uncharacterized protein isoform X2 n=1 Tax=Palaemon carinicauda TaxID=392227 RepID=UPI0035B5EBD5
MALEKANAFRTCGITKRGEDCVVWAKLDDELYWPGKIKNCAYIFKNGCDQQLVYVFGKKKCLWVKKNNIMPYLKYKTLFKRVNSMTQSLKLSGRNEEKLVSAMCDVEDYITKCGNADVCFERPIYVTESASYMVMDSGCGHAVLQDTTKPGRGVQVEVTRDLQIPSRLKLRECSVVLEDIFSKGPRNYARLFSLLKQNKSTCPSILSRGVYNSMSSAELSEGPRLQPNVPENRVPQMPKSFEYQPFCLQSAVTPRSLDSQTPKLEDSKNFLWQDPHMSPSLGSEISKLLQCQGFESPNIPSFETPNIPSFEAINTLSSEAPNAPSPEAINTPNSEAPNVPSFEASNTPNSEAPNVPSFEASNTPNSEALNTLSTEAPNTPSSESSNVPSSETPNTQNSEAPDIPSNETPNVPISEAPNIPISEAPNIPSFEAPDVPSSLALNTQSSEAPNAPSSETLVQQSSQTPELQRFESPNPQDSQTPASQTSQTTKLSGTKKRRKRSSSTPKSPRAQRVKLQETQTPAQTPKVHARKAPEAPSPQSPKCGRRKRRKPYDSPMYKLRRCSVVLQDVMKITKNTEVQSLPLPWKKRSRPAKRSKPVKVKDSHEKENLLEAMKNMFNAAKVPVKIAQDAHKKIEKVKRCHAMLHSRRLQRQKTSHSRAPRRPASSSDVSEAPVDDAVLPSPEMTTSDGSADDAEETAKNDPQETRETSSRTENSESEDRDGTAEKDQHRDSLEQSELGCLSAYFALNPEYIKCEYAEDDLGTVKGDESAAKSVQNGHLLDEDCENKSCKLEDLIDSNLTEALFSTNLIEQECLSSALSMEPHFLQPDVSLDTLCNAQENSVADDALDFSDLDGLVVVKNETESNLSIGEENEENDASQFPLSNERD